jgi:hypothetical protein
MLAHWEVKGFSGLGIISHEAGRPVGFPRGGESLQKAHKTALA